MRPTSERPCRRAAPPWQSGGPLFTISESSEAGGRSAGRPRRSRSRPFGLGRPFVPRPATLAPPATPSPTDHVDPHDHASRMDHRDRPGAPEGAGTARPGDHLGQAARHGRHGLQLGPAVEPLAAGLRPGLLRHRDDLHGVQPVRHRPVRRRGLPRLAPPGRRDDRLGHRHQDDDADDRPALRPDARAEVRDQHGGLRHRAAGRSRRGTTSSRGSTSTCRSTSTSPAARRRPRPCSTA